MGMASRGKLCTECLGLETSETERFSLKSLLVQGISGAVRSPLLYILCVCVVGLLLLQQLVSVSCATTADKKLQREELKPHLRSKSCWIADDLFDL